MKLYRLKPNKTVKRAPGPGAMRRRDWEPIAKGDLSRRVRLEWQTADDNPQSALEEEEEEEKKVDAGSDCQPGNLRQDV